MALPALSVPDAPLDIGAQRQDEDGRGLAPRRMRRIAGSSALAVLRTPRSLSNSPSTGARWRRRGVGAAFGAALFRGGPPGIVLASAGAVGVMVAATLGLRALVGAILGGVGSVPGALAGGLMLGGFEALWTACFAADYRDAAVFALLAGVLAWRPAGLLGAGENSGRRWA